MGSSAHPLGRVLGRFLFLRARGSEWAQIGKGYASPIALTMMASKYLGVTGWLAVAIGLAVPVVVELLGIAAGWYDARVGSAWHQTQFNVEQDPFKVELLDLTRANNRLLQAMLVSDRASRGINIEDIPRAAMGIAPGL